MHNIYLHMKLNTYKRAYEDINILPNIQIYLRTYKTFIDI